MMLHYSSKNKILQTGIYHFLPVNSSLGSIPEWGPGRYSSLTSAILVTYHATGCFSRVHTPLLYSYILAVNHRQVWTSVECLSICQKIASPCKVQTLSVSNTSLRNQAEINLASSAAAFIFKSHIFSNRSLRVAGITLVISGTGSMELKLHFL